MVRLIVELIRAYAVCVLMRRVAVMIVICTIRSVIMTAVRVRSTGMGKAA